MLRLLLLTVLVLAGMRLLEAEHVRGAHEMRPPATPSAAASVSPRPRAASRTHDLPAAPADPEPPEPVDPVLRAVPPAGHQPVPTGEFLIAPGVGAVVGDGPARRYLVEVEQGSGVDAAVFAEAVETVLSDPHSWIAAGDVGLHRVDSEPVDFRVTLAHPATVDRHCAGLDTAGRYSCWNGSRAMLHLGNWIAGIPDYAGDVGGYRRYLINHEVGHALGHGHQQCPAAGAPAPVMMQQTKGIAPCVPNSWPYP